MYWSKGEGGWIGRGARRRTIRKIIEMRINESDGLVTKSKIKLDKAILYFTKILASESNQKVLTVLELERYSREYHIIQQDSIITKNRLYLILDKMDEVEDYFPTVSRDELNMIQEKECKERVDNSISAFKVFFSFGFIVMICYWVYHLWAIDFTVG